MRNLLAVALVSCASSPSHPADPITSEEPPIRMIASEPAAPPPVITPIEEAVAEASANPPYASDIRSVRFLRGYAVKKEPRAEAAAAGVAKKGTHAAIQRALPPGNGCASRWIEIQPRGFVCEDVLEPSSAAPTVASTFALDGDDDVGPLVPGVYGIVRGTNAQSFASRDDVLAGNGRALAGSNTVRAAGAISIDGERYWRTSRGELINARSIAQISPSKFRGLAIADGARLPAWIRSHESSRKPVVTRATPSRRGKATGELAPRTVVTIEEESADGRFVRVAEGAWISRADVRVATLAAAPPGTTANEKWFDVDLDQQTLVAYEGERPVYATLVSTGKYLHATPTSVARIASKHESAAMTSDTEGSVYSVADVPWTMYYDGDFALHTSYWHDGFGGPRSHGCVNLAPRDARKLFQWSSPDVPPGWSTVYGDADNPGTLVRVRSKKVAEPAFRGYARALRDRAVVATSN
ncbi:MAG: L,D-transpeptidase [Deltaproteobacteria bacterium]|nr:L,D-transpeptidase [Deltaproteobacteria bacterium]